MIVLKDIETKTFDKAFVGGYNPAEVDKFLDEVYDSFKNVCDDNENLKEKILILAKKVEEYRNDEENIKNALLDAQKLKTSVKNDIEKQNADIIEKANAEAENIINEAKAEAENILSVAKDKAEKEEAELQDKISKGEAELRDKISNEEEKFEEIKEAVHNFKKDIFDLYKEHLELLNKLPSYKKNPKVEQENNPSVNEISTDENSSERKNDIKSEELEAIKDSENVNEIEAIKEDTTTLDTEDTQPVVEEVSEKLYKDEIKVENLKFGVDYDIDNDFDDDDEYIN